VAAPSEENKNASQFILAACPKALIPANNLAANAV
jgi:hypothetical protein